MSKTMCGAGQSMSVMLKNKLIAYVNKFFTYPLHFRHSKPFVTLSPTEKNSYLNYVLKTKYLKKSTY